MIRLTPVHIDQRATDAVVAVLQSGQIAQGQEVDAFEREFAAPAPRRIAGVRRAVQGYPPKT